MLKKVVCTNLLILAALYSQFSFSERINLSDKQDFEQTVGEFNKSMKLYENKDKFDILLGSLNAYNYTDNNFAEDKLFFLDVLTKKYPLNTVLGKGNNTYAYELSKVNLADYMQIYITYEDRTIFNKLNVAGKNKPKLDNTSAYYAYKYIYTANITPELISGNINYLLNQKGFPALFRSNEKIDKDYLEMIKKERQAIKENNFDMWMKSRESDIEFMELIKGIKENKISIDKQKDFFKILSFYKNYVF